MKQENYILGFLFSEDKQSVVLIKKNRPAWQAGRLNGIGGKVEKRDLGVYTAMHREALEEMDVTTPWVQRGVMFSDTWHCSVFASFDDVAFAAAKTMESEEILKVYIDDLNLYPQVESMKSLIELCLCPDDFTFELKYK